MGKAILAGLTLVILLELAAIVAVVRADAQPAEDFTAALAATRAALAQESVEVGVALDGYGRVLLRRVGTLDELRLSEADYLRIRGRGYLLHSHPLQSPCRLSDGDIAAAQEAGLWGVEAVCADGSIDRWMVTP